MVLLPELGLLALMFFALALALSGKKLAEALQQAMRAVPIIGRAIAAILAPIPHGLAWAAGQLEHGIDVLLGATWHALARMTDWLWSQMVQHTAATLHLARLLGHEIYVHSGLQGAVHDLVKKYRGIEHGVKTLRREYDHLRSRVRALEREVGAGIGDDLRTRFDELHREWTRFRTKELPGIESDVARVPGEIADAEEWVRKTFVSDAALATEAGAAVVLTALGLNWLRCESNPFNRNKGACGLWGDLSDILGLAVFAAAALDFEALVHEAQDVTEVTVGAVKDVFGLDG